MGGSSKDHECRWFTWAGWRLPILSVLPYMQQEYDGLSLSPLLGCDVMMPLLTCGIDT